MTGTRHLARVRLVAVIAIGEALLLAILVANKYQTPTRVDQPEVIGSQTGTVSRVNGTGNGICVAVGGTDLACGDLWRTPGQAVPEVGSRVSFWVLRVPASGGTMVEEFVLQPVAGAGGV